MTTFSTDTDTTAYTEEACFLCSSVDGVPTLTNSIIFNYAGNISATVNFNPLVVGLVGNSLNLELPLGVSIDEDFQGYFSVPSDLLLSASASILDGDVTIDFPLISSVLGINPNEPILDSLEDFGITVPNFVVEIFDALDITDANSAIELFDDLLDVELAGDGTLTTITGTDNFTFNYVSDTNSLEVEGLNPLVVAGSFIGQSTIATQGDFSVDLVLSEFVEVTNLLGIDLPSDVLFLITLSQMFGINEIELASGSFNSDVTLVPSFTPLTGYTDSVSAAFAQDLSPIPVVI